MAFTMALPSLHAKRVGGIGKNEEKETKERDN
jgi:hypothetical protein